MGNTRNWTRDFIAMTDALKRGLKTKGCTSRTKKRAAMDRAASGRPSDLPAKAREAVATRRVQRDLDMIAGRS